MAPGIPMWLEVLRAVAPLFAAVLAAGVGAWVTHKFGRIQEDIARQQAATAAAAAQTAKSKLRLDLFERRLNVYNAAMTAITTTLQNGDFSATDEREFLIGIQGARWIFDERIYHYLRHELWDQLTDLHMANQNLKDAIADRKALAEARGEAFRKIRDQLLHADEVFAPALQLSA